MPLGKTLQELSSKSRRSAKVCSYQLLYDSLSKEDQKALDSAWEIEMPIAVVVRALRQEGHKTSMDSLRTHRKGECKCPKK